MACEQSIFRSEAGMNLDIDALRSYVVVAEHRNGKRPAITLLRQPASVVHNYFSSPGATLVA